MLQRSCVCAFSCFLKPSYFFFWALTPALVVVPETSLAVTDLMTPTATVCLMSRTAKRPSGGKSEKASTHMGLEGTKLTMAASPDLMDLGLSSVDFPARRKSSFNNSFATSALKMLAKEIYKNLFYRGYTQRK